MKMQIYFNKTYKKLRWDDFKDTNDFHIQEIKFFIETIQKAKNFDINQYGQSLQNFIISLEKPIMMAVENKMVKSSISK
jgi:hypothetical protein